MGLYSLRYATQPKIGMYDSLENTIGHVHKDIYTNNIG